MTDHVTVRMPGNHERREMLDAVGAARGGGGTRCAGLARSRRPPPLPAPKLDAHAHILSRDLATWMRSSSRTPRSVAPCGRSTAASLSSPRGGRHRSGDRAVDRVPARERLSRGGRREEAGRRIPRRPERARLHRGAGRRVRAPLIPVCQREPEARLRDCRVLALRRYGFRMRGLSVHFGESDVRLRDPQHL